MIFHNWFKNLKRIWRVKSQMMQDLNYYKKEVKDWHNLVEQYKISHKDLSSKNARLYKLICEKIETLCKLQGIK